MFRFISTLLYKINEIIICISQINYWIEPCSPKNGPETCDTCVSGPHKSSAGPSRRVSHKEPHAASPKLCLKNLERQLNMTSLEALKNIHYSLNTPLSPIIPNNEYTRYITGNISPFFKTGYRPEDISTLTYFIRLDKWSGKGIYGHANIDLFTFDINLRVVKRNLGRSLPLLDIENCLLFCKTYPPILDTAPYGNTCGEYANLSFVFCAVKF